MNPVRNYKSPESVMEKKISNGMNDKKRNWLFRKLQCGRLIKLDVDVFYELQDNCISFGEKGKRPRVVLFLTKGKEPIKTIPLARYILKIPKGSIADHRNRDIFDNRRENLRAVDCRQSALNRKFSNRPTDYLGVSFMRSSKYAFRYKAQYLPEKGKSHP
jgi:hypothetical protein